MKHFGVIVVGGGHAGAEAAAACSRLGVRTLLVSGRLSNIGVLSCNPAVGGVGKGHLVREIDALGGIMGRVTDRATIQFRVLNRGKGPAVWSPRAQVDRQLYPRQMQKELKRRENLEFLEGNVVKIMERGGRIRGVVLDDGRIVQSGAVILCCGTFLEGIIHTGRTITEGGRIGEKPVKGLTASITDCGLKARRFKTGTPPRVGGAGVDFEAMVRQDGEKPRGGFSFFEKRGPLDQLPCWITATSQLTHGIILDHLDEAPLFTGQIKARGPRYCPSIEDKVVRFPDRESHIVFVEPEGRGSGDFYLNGLSTSLPVELQPEIVHSVRGLEKAEIVQYGYAIEYDYFSPESLTQTLETKTVEGLFCAGQINGTTGYEEAAAQGLIAGINAAHSVLGREAFILNRTDAVIGVLVDDLVTKGVSEPYRMFTSRVEYRLTLRADNADLRLSERGRKLGLLSEEDYRVVLRRRESLEKLERLLEEENIDPVEVNDYLEAVGSSRIEEPVRLSRLLKRPEVRLSGLLERCSACSDPPDEDVARQVELEVKYEGYFRREWKDIENLRRQETVLIPDDFPYERVRNLSTEAREKLAAVRPRSLGQASRISGVSVSDLAALLLEIAKRGVSRETSRQVGAEDERSV
ncbi:MAG: tRNA uridine-5-carboxymethylaminomethyl(34) synthesis enzyme MnmG [Candidatus Glassbacteria bacterium]